MPTPSPAAPRARPWGETARALLLLLVCATPLAALVVRALPGLGDPQLVHLATTVLPAEVGASLAVSLLAVVLAALFSAGGVLGALFDFPGRVVLTRLTLLPLLVPPWFLAVIYGHVHGVSGELALAAVMGLCGAPLFQLLVTASQRTVPAPFLESLRQLGHGSPVAILGHLLPLSAPTAAAAAAVTFLLALGDAAGARALGVPTLTVGLYDHWFGRHSDAAGAPLALLLVLLAVLPALALLAALARRGFRLAPRLARRPMTRVPLHGAAGLLPWLLAAPLLAGGVLYPGWLIARWTVDRVDRVRLSTLGLDVAQSLGLALAVAAVAALLGLAVLRRGVADAAPRISAVTGRVLLATFAIPPVVLGMAFLWLLPEGESTPWAPWLNRTVLPLVAALGLRYGAVFLVMGQAALARIPRAYSDLLRATGRTGAVSVVTLLRPFVAGAAGAAAALVVLAALQDLSLTLLLQPFGLDTVSSRLYQYAATQRIPEAGIWVLCLALVGVYPLMRLSRLVETAADGEEDP